MLCEHETLIATLAQPAETLLLLPVQTHQQFACASFLLRKKTQRFMTLKMSATVAWQTIGTSVHAHAMHQLHAPAWLMQRSANNTPY